MNSGRFFMPNMNIMPFYRIGGINPALRANFMVPRSANMLSRAVNGIRAFNWRGLLSGANKTLNVVNQTIPLIRQAKPMVANVKSMIQLAKAFGNETGNNRYKSSSVLVKNSHNKQGNKRNDNLVVDNNYPTFFV